MVGMLELLNQEFETAVINMLMAVNGKSGNMQEQIRNVSRKKL